VKIYPKSKTKILYQTCLIFFFLFGFFAFLKVSTGATFNLMDKCFFELKFVILFLFIAFIVFTLLNARKYYKLRFFILVSIFLLILFSSLFFLIEIRRQTGNDLVVHDSTVITEEAVKFLDQGKNFYTEDYYDTQYSVYKDIFKGGENPAMKHYVYLPFTVIFAWPFYHILDTLFGFFDLRLVYLLLFLLGGFLIYRIPKNKENKILALIIFFLNPALLFYFVAGYNDIFILVLIILSLYFLKKYNYFWSALFLGLAVISKQSAVLIIPFYFYYLYLLKRKEKIFKRIKFILQKSWIFLVMIIMTFSFFLIWDAGSFISDTFQKLMGGLESNYPISGIGFSNLLLEMNIINNQWDNYPFWICQLVIGLIALFVLLKWQKINNDISFLLLAYALFLFIVWYFARYFHESHLFYIIYVLSLAYIFKLNESKND